MYSYNAKVQINLNITKLVDKESRVLLIIFPMSHNFCITPNETPVSLES